MSLRLRLALWYGGLAGLLVLLVCTYSYAAHGRAHYDEADAGLATSAEHVAIELTHSKTSEQRAAVMKASVIMGPAMRVYGTDGAVLARSDTGSWAPTLTLDEAFAPAPPPYPFLARYAPALHESSGHGGRFGLVRVGARWRVYARPISGRDEYLVALAPLATIDASVRRFGVLMVLMAVTGAVVTFLAGWVVAASALRPVAAVTQTARAIARSRRFSQRVSPDSVRSQQDELGRLSGTFNEMLASLEEAYAAQQQFVSDASHELRAPLTSIQANLELLQARADMSVDERARAVSEAAAEANRLGRLVADLLALARADGGTTLRCEEVELDRVLMDVVGDARHLVHGQQLEIEVLEPSVMRGDRDRIKQLLLILVDNAIKYTPPPGGVRVSLRRADTDAVFEVRDTGIGIAAADLPRVFERFYRADRARSRDSGGTGLGLPIARWIVTEHGGTVELASAPGRGTTATVRLPLTHALSRRSGPPQHRTAALARRKRTTASHLLQKEHPMRSDCSTLSARAFGFAAGTVAAVISAACAAALAVAPGATRTLLGYLIHSDLSGLTPVVSWGSFFAGVVGWGLIAGVAFSAAAALYNRSILARAERGPAAAPGLVSRA